ncbi:helix-turn-helix domain-containing protein [Kutzneria kofuensis]|uniref:helix-turn-helix domain-containing protein n=1 Tax=Kutzneria kofuensis TaxID=103725 RepID=UPI003CD0976C
MREAAFELFARQGFEQTSVDDIAARAEVSRASFFRTSSQGGRPQLRRRAAAAAFAEELRARGVNRPGGAEGGGEGARGGHGRADEGPHGRVREADDGIPNPARPGLRDPERVAAAGGDPSEDPAWPTARTRTSRRRCWRSSR